MRKNTLVIPIALACVAAAVAASVYFLGARLAPAGPRGPKLNVLLITLDTTRADRLGCYGYAKPTSPRLDKLAAESARFDKAIAQASVTPVSHASVLTGLNPYQHGLRVLHGRIENRLAADKTTLPEVWQQAGGETAAFISAFPAGSSFGLDQGFDVFDERFPHSDGAGIISDKGVVNTGASQRRSELTTGAALEWLRNRDSDSSFLLWLHYFDPHDFEQIPPLEWAGENIGQFKRSADEPLYALQEMYDAEIRYMDEQIGRVFDELEQLKLWDNTAVVVVADHGEGLGDHDWWSHGVLYQEQIHVPLIVRIPGVTRPAEIESLVRTTDVMPTLLEALEIDRQNWPAMDGQSLMKLLAGEDAGSPRTAYSDSVNMMVYARHDNQQDRKLDKLYCLMDERYKLIFHQLKPEESEFYDLQADPAESHNLASDKPPEMDSMLETLKGLNPFSEVVPGMSPTDVERLEKLKSLGYVR